MGIHNDFFRLRKNQPDLLEVTDGVFGHCDSELSAPNIARVRCPELLQFLIRILRRSLLPIYKEITYAREFDFLQRRTQIVRVNVTKLQIFSTYDFFHTFPHKNAFFTVLMKFS